MAPFSRKPVELNIDRLLEAIQANADIAAEDREATREELAAIHTLVNSNLTASRRAELDATVRDVASMREVVRLNQIAGNEPSRETLQAIQAGEDRILELRATISDRLAATKIASDQVD